MPDRVLDPPTVPIARLDRSSRPGRRVRPPERLRLTHRPALDGLRAVAVVVVLLFHGGVSWLPGGWLGVDAFFVLSGYLITTLLLAEHERTGSIRLGAFWARRARRLLPALLTVVATVLGCARWLVPPEELAALGPDALAALGYVANWRMLDRGDGYAVLTSAPSPLQHTWSLALEEQFYLLWPLLVVGALALWSARALLVGTLVAAAASAGAMALLYVPDAEPARAYYGSDTRAFGLLAGCALALVLSARRYRPGHAARRRWSPAVLAAAGVLAAALLLLDDVGPALYRGGLLLVVLAVAAVISDAEREPDGLTARLLSVPPLPRIGRVSYELYLWHWPVFLALDSQRTGLDGLMLLVARCAATIVLAELTFHFLSRPIRAGRWPRPGTVRPILTTLGATACVVIAALVLTTPPAPRPTTPDGPATALRTTGPSTLLDRPGRAPGPLRITVFGDSVAHSLAIGLPLVSGARVTNRALIGCGIARSGPVRNAARIQDPYERCPRWDAYWADGVRADRPDVALVVLARWEVLDRKLRGRWQHIGQPAYDAYLRTELARMIQVLTADGARVVLATAPYNHRYERRDGSLYPEDDPARMDAWNRMLVDTTRTHPDRVRVVDLGARLCPDGRYARDVDGIRVRSDGLHLTRGGVRDYLAPWLLPQLVGAAG
ncbi:acyltransferase family protein [Cryptosporangium aurantiacum]|uniref:Peptidoglycan/LPS O-acetylase OafA/YrhL, contains acyltransferase and SGNH-hydrolase domains n=1 Tax=Cryptosporangium aurantiacum TaxID=134849 RepID=A0A1M7RP05_9ACTN|nr:acyltransferase family protein [Cryptosporangium aurantiacum]SHN48043.1 Peptidoglycan/LPS O-acetylase OafA/YrhL, contains acyltransferase and SGNH-hydrolase domains [Cryptosporangium aurantiacum]